MREESTGAIVTPPGTPVHGDAYAPLPSLRTSARESGALCLPTPPNTPQAPLHIRARALLRSTTDSFDVIGRQAERKFVSDFLEPFFGGSPGFDNSPTSLYISGSPGTGKTALVTSTLARMKTDDVRTAYINCMGLKDVDVLWSRVIATLGEPSISRKTKASNFRQFERKLAEETFKWFVRLNRIEVSLIDPITRSVLVLDELDTIAPSSLSVIFGLPGRFPSSLRVIAISNDLTQNLTSPALSIHRPSLTLAFSAYTAVEMQEIIRARVALLASDNIYDNPTQSRADVLAKIIQPAALTLLVKKVSSQTGDIRRALELLRRAIDLAAPASTALESDDTPPSPVGMSHVIDAVKKAKAPGIVSPSANKSTLTVSGGRLGPLDGCVSALGLQARLVLVAILIARRRTAHGLPLDYLSLSSTTCASPVNSSPSKPKMRRCASLGGSDDQLSPSKVYTLYSNILRASPSAPFEPVSRSEFTDLLGVLETASVIVVPSMSSPSPTTPKRARKGASFSGGISATSLLHREGGSIVLCTAEDEVLRALLATAGALDAEITQIWERETKRIEKALTQRSAMPTEPALDREDYL